MSRAVASRESNAMATIEQVLIRGDLANLIESQRVQYYQEVCKLVGLNPTTKPFDYITLNGKLVLYANKGCAEQLRQVHKISIRITSRETHEGVYVVTAQAEGRGGRVDESTGAVTIKALGGEELANAMMKAETKAKRRVTLSICGLNMLDDTEVQSIPEAKPFAQEPAPSPRVVPATTKAELEPPTPKRDRKQVGAEIRACCQAMRLEKTEVDGWVQEIFKKPTPELTLPEMEKFLETLQTEMGRNGVVSQ